MSKGPQPFKQSDVTKAVKATVKAGLPVERVEIAKDGKIVIVTSKSSAAENGGDKVDGNEWDGVLK